MPNSKKCSKGDVKSNVGSEWKCRSIESNQRGYTSPALYVGYGHLKEGYWMDGHHTRTNFNRRTHDIYTPAIHQSSDK